MEAREGNVSVYETPRVSINGRDIASVDNAAIMREIIALVRKVQEQRDTIISLSKQLDVLKKQHAKGSK